MGVRTNKEQPEEKQLLIAPLVLIASKHIVKLSFAIVEKILKKKEASALQ